jgi:acyl-coenzyme A thioesterase PaaI-like protein
VAAELTVRFVARLPVGTALTVRGRFVQDKRLFWRCEGTIEDDAGTVYASARGTYVPMTRDESERIERETLIYPEGTARIFS